MAQLGYDATTFGNHEFDFGPAGLGQIIRSAVDHGPAPAIVIANAAFEVPDPELAKLHQLNMQGHVRPYTVITRGGVRFGLFGLPGVLREQRRLLDSLLAAGEAALQGTAAPSLLAAPQGG